MSSIELRGLEVSQGFWDEMCSLNLIYVKVKAIVLTKERNTINMQSADTGVCGCTQRGIWLGQCEDAVLENTARGEMHEFYSLLTSSFSLCSFRMKESCSSEACRTLRSQAGMSLLSPVPVLASSPSPISSCRNLTSGPVQSQFLLLSQAQNPEDSFCGLQTICHHHNKEKNIHTGFHKIICFSASSLRASVSFQGCWAPCLQPEPSQGHACQQLHGDSSEMCGPRRCLAPIYRNLFNYKMISQRRKWKSSHVMV